MIYVIVIVLATTVVLQFFTIHSWKKNAHECMKRYDECFIHFEKSVKLCEQMQNDLDKLAKINNELIDWNKILISRLDNKEEHKND